MENPFGSLGNIALFHCTPGISVNFPRLETPEVKMKNKNGYWNSLLFLSPLFSWKNFFFSYRQSHLYQENTWLHRLVIFPKPGLHWEAFSCRNLSSKSSVLDPKFKLKISRSRSKIWAQNHPFLIQNLSSKSSVLDHYVVDACTWRAHVYLRIHLGIFLFTKTLIVFTFLQRTRCILRGNWGWRGKRTNT